MVNMELRKQGPITQNLNHLRETGYRKSYTRSHRTEGQADKPELSGTGSREGSPRPSLPFMSLGYSAVQHPVGQPASSNLKSMEPSSV